MALDNIKTRQGDVAERFPTFPSDVQGVRFGGAHVVEGQTLLVQKPHIDKRPTVANLLPAMPLRVSDAKAYIRRLLEGGIFVVSDHARREMKKDDLSDPDAINILRGGVVREPEWENGSWRYRVETPRMCFVVAFDPDPDTLPEKDADLAEVELVVVTAWRIRS